MKENSVGSQNETESFLRLYTSPLVPGLPVIK